MKAKPSFIADMAVLSKFVALNRSNQKFQRYVEELKAAKETQEQALNQQLAALVQSFEHAQAFGNNLEQERQNLVALAEARRMQIEGLTQREAELQGRLNELAGQVQQARDEANQHAAVAAADYVTSNKALEEENELLLLQLHQVQEELEKYLMENIDLKQKKQFHPETIDEVEVQKVKSHLSYRLGSTLIKYGKTPFGWLWLPFALIQQIRAYRHYQRLKN